jgi:hypothetical protein
MRRIGKRCATSFLGAFAALLLAGTAVADKEQIHLTGAGQAAARAAVMHRADLGSAGGWTGGVKKPDLSSGTGCANFKPKQSDLVLIGAAETVFRHPGVEFDSEAQVLETPAMVRLDWQRTVLAPQVTPCLRRNLEHQLTSSERLVAVRRIAFPAIAAYTRAYRATVDVKSAAGTARVLVDLVLLGRANVEITLTTTAPMAAEPAVRGAELRLARVLVGRVSG